MKIIKHIEPPIKDKLKAHYFDRYRPSIDGNKILSSVGDQSEGREIQPGRCYDFDGVDDYIAIASPDVGTLYVSGLGSDGELSTTLTIGYFSNHYQISGSGKIWNIKVWTSDTATETQKKSYTLESGLFAWYKCDEGTGVNSYDSSGNGNHGTITNASLETFHSTQNIYSWQNEVGYSIGSNFYIPRDELDPSKDVLGNDLEYKGQVAYNALAKQSNCLYLDGIDDVIQFDDTTGWDRLENAGTSELSINGNNIEGTEGSVYNLRVYDGSDNLIHLFPCSEGGGTRINCVLGGTIGTLVNATLETVWDKQDEYHYNIKEGYSKGKGFSIRSNDIIRAPDGNIEYRYTSQEGINYQFSTGTFYNPSTGLNDPEGNPIGYTSEYFNFYKELVGSLMAISSSFSANTVKIDCEVKSGLITQLQGRDNTLQQKFYTTLNNEYGAGTGNNSAFANQGEFYWAISGLDPTYGESFPETVGFPVGTTSQDLRDLLVSIGIENIVAFIEDLSNTPSVSWYFCLQRTFNITLNVDNTYGRTKIELDVFDIKPNGAVSAGNMVNYYLQYNTMLERYSNLELRCANDTWVHFYSITIDENHVIPASLTNHNQDATGLKLENIAGRYHNGAETLMDFTGGIESPYAVQFELPNNYAFGDPIEYKEEANNIEKNILIYEGVDSGEDIRIRNFVKDI